MTRSRRDTTRSARNIGLPLAALLAAGSCDAASGLGPTRHVAAVLDLPAAPAAVSPCLAAAYRRDGFGVLLRSDPEGGAVVIDIHGMPSSARRTHWQPVPRMTIELQPMTEAASRATLRTAPTLLGSDRDALTFRTRAAACAS
ncbi:MAG: hypothetical protein K2X74_21930 [Acetobacteraceae bacterium]|nr:hypothetical protein [Acetobacteraceae bacterium]